MNRLIKAVEITSYGSPGKDRTVRVTIHLNELDSEQHEILRRLHDDKHGFVCLQTEPIGADVTDLLSNLDVEVGETKTPSQRLRNT